MCTVSVVLNRTVVSLPHCQEVLSGQVCCRWSNGALCSSIQPLFFQLCRHEITFELRFLLTSNLTALERLKLNPCVKCSVPLLPLWIVLPVLMLVGQSHMRRGIIWYAYQHILIWQLLWGAEWVRFITINSCQLSLLHKSRKGKSF